jgi:hypothetical protein
MGTLEGKVAIITGAARGQGETSARLFDDSTNCTGGDFCIDGGAVAVLPIPPKTL